MGLFERKLPKQQELEQKIQTLRSAGMTASAERLEAQLSAFLHASGKDEKIKPMNQKQLTKVVKEQKALGQKA